MECQKLQCDKYKCKYFSKSLFDSKVQNFKNPKINMEKGDHCLLQTIHEEKVKLYG